MNPDLDKLFLHGKITEDEYCNLAMNTGQVVAVAIDDIDRITTVSLSLTPKGYSGEVLYSPESLRSDEKFLKSESSFQQAKLAFMKRIAQLESTSEHKFDVTWFK